jgi:hypothetical protein
MLQGLSNACGKSESTDEERASRRPRSKATELSVFRQGPRRKYEYCPGRWKRHHGIPSSAMFWRYSGKYLFPYVVFELLILLNKTLMHVVLRCWDGKNLDSPDHQSHVAYPEIGTFERGGTCPKSHPVKIPQILYETIWDTTQFNDKSIWPVDGSQPFVFSTGDA